MQKILSVNDIKVYSRKEIVAWVQSSNTSSFQQLKNGLFFLKILRKLVPNDLQRSKIVEKPINQYQQTQNMNIVKKVLNKHNLQLNMNVQSIIASKNCFQLANWFKNLYDQNKSDADTDFHYSEKSFTPSKVLDQGSVSGYKSLSRATSSDKKTGNGNGNVKKLGRVTSGFVGIPKAEKFTSTLRIPKQVFDSQLTYQLFSNKCNESKNQRSRTLKPQQLRSAKSKTKYPTNLNNWFNSPTNPNNNTNTTFLQKQRTGKKKQLTEEETITNLMKIQALEEQIGEIQKIVGKVAGYVASCEGMGLEKMRKDVLGIIYGGKGVDQGDGDKENCGDGK